MYIYIYIYIYIYSGLEFSSVNHNSMHENSELKVFYNKVFFLEISNN